MIHKYNFRITILKETSLNESTVDKMNSIENKGKFALLGSTAQSPQMTPKTSSVQST